MSGTIDHSPSTLYITHLNEANKFNENLSPEVSNPLDKSSKTILEATEPLTQVCRCYGATNFRVNSHENQKTKCKIFIYHINGSEAIDTIYGILRTVDDTC